MADDPRPAETAEGFEELLEFLSRSRGFDFTAYKRSSLARRIQKRLQAVGAASYRDYRTWLESHPDEFGMLFNTILINVTSFFRDPEAWDFLAREILPRIVAEAPDQAPIRVWDPGCASGQEAYTIAMLLAERLGVEGYKHRVKIYASDVDEEALTRARHATYTSAETQDVPGPLLERYFERVDDRYVFNKELRRNVIFGRQDLVQDAPISRVHLLVCRNTLMYFTRDTQARVLSRFHFALRDQGFLFMGKAELLLTHADLFVPVDLKWRVFTKVVDEYRREIGVPPRHEEVTPTMAAEDRFVSLSLDSDPTARIVLNASGVLVHANERARVLLRLGPPDVGRRLQDLELAYRPIDLRSMVEETLATRRPTSRKDVPWQEGTEPRVLEVQVVPLVQAAELLGVQVLFLDVTRYRKLQEQLEQSKNELETAYEELQSSNEELETTNEELQSTNEELETTNEELQSTNEELETMNEELQSTNEELETINTELRMRSEELNQANAFLGSILAGLEMGVAVVDPDVRVLAWNHRAEDLWGLRADEVTGRHLMNLDIGLPVAQLLKPIRSVLAKETNRVEVRLEAVNRRGRTIACHVTCTPLSGSTGERRGVIVLMEEQPPAGA